MSGMTYYIEWTYREWGAAATSVSPARRTVPPNQPHPTALVIDLSDAYRLGPVTSKPQLTTGYDAVRHTLDVDRDARGAAVGSERDDDSDGPNGDYVAGCLR